MRHGTPPTSLRRRSFAFALFVASLVPAAAAVAADEKVAGPGAGWTLDSNHLGLQRLTTPGIDRDWTGSRSRT